MDESDKEREDAAQERLAVAVRGREKLKNGIAGGLAQKPRGVLQQGQRPPLHCARRRLEKRLRGAQGRDAELRVLVLLGRRRTAAVKRLHRRAAEVGEVEHEADARACARRGELLLRGAEQWKEQVRADAMLVLLLLLVNREAPDT